MELDFTVIERGSTIGGTWYWNNYPGIGCDVPSHLYSFSFYLKSNWTHLFSYGAEIQRYLRSCFYYFGLGENIGKGWIHDTRKASSRFNLKKSLILKLLERFGMRIHDSGKSQNWRMEKRQMNLLIFLFLALEVFIDQTGAVSEVWRNTKGSKSTLLGGQKYVKFEQSEI